MSLSVALAAALLAFAAILAYLLYCVGLRARQDKPDPHWLGTFSVERYRPMVRLLSETDYDYLRSQGVDQAAIRRLRSARRRIFGVYLRNLIRDFNRLHWAAQNILFEAQVDSPELAQRLVKSRVLFQRAVLTVRVRLALHAIGLGGFDPGRILEALELLNTEVQALVAVSAGSATHA